MPQTNTQVSNPSQNTQDKQGQGQVLSGVHPKTKRPTSLISQGKHITYTYDIHGNIKTKTETPLNPKTNEPIYQSDNGLIGYRKSVQFFYSPNNELKQTITITDTGLEVQRTTTTYFYDAFGRRIAKTSKVEQLHKLNQRGELVRYPTALMHLRKTDKTTYQSTLMLWEGNRQIQEYTNNHIFTTIYDQDSFEPVARVVQVRNSSDDKHLKNVQGRDDTCDDLKIYHYHNNHLGTPQELTDECGEVIWCNYEWAWGGRYTHHYISQSLNDCAILEHDLQPIRFQGQFYDIETGLHYNRFRYYDSDVGMFIQRDPIGLLGGVNVFAYAPNPVGWVDVLGLSCINSNIPNKKTHFNANSRKQAFRQAKKDAGIPISQHPKEVRYVDLDDGYGNKVLDNRHTPIQAREYLFQNNRGETIVIQEHSLGHQKATQNKGLEPHFNVRPISNTNTGSVKGTHGHYNFKKKR